MKKLWIVFDQLTSIKDGGLIATYMNMVPLIQQDYEIHIVSIFNCSDEVKNEKAFGNSFFHVMNGIIIDNRFFRVFNYIKNGNLKGALYAIFSAFVYFFSAPFVRIKMSSLVSNHDLILVSSPAAAMFMNKRIPFILDIHTSFDYFFGNNVLGRMQTLLMRKPALTVFRNQSDAKKGEGRFLTDYLYHFVPDKDSTEKKVSKSDKKKIVFVGRLHEHKNPLRLLECASLFKSSGVDFDLDIYGTGPMEDEINRRIQALDLQDCVFLKGFLTDKTVISQYDLMWLTSSLEGFGLVLIEAKANHVPVISVEWGEPVYEVIHHGIDGYVVKSNEELVHKTLDLLIDDNNLSLFSLKAYEDYLKRFSQQSYQHRLLTLLRRFESEFLNE